MSRSRWRSERRRRKGIPNNCITEYARSHSIDHRLTQSRICPSVLANGAISTLFHLHFIHHAMEPLRPQTSLAQGLKRTTC